MNFLPELEFSEQLRALAVIVEDPVLVPGTHMAVQVPVTPVPWVLMPSSGICRHCTHVAHIHVCRQTHVPIKYK